VNFGVIVTFVTFVTFVIFTIAIAIVIATTLTMGVLEVVK